MPNRIIKESICTSDSVDQLSWFEEVLFYRLIVSCDDYGRFDGRPAIIKGRLFPLKSVTDKQIESAIIKLSTAGIAKLYRVDGRPYLQLCAWERHQQIRAKKSKYPPPNENEPDDNDCNGYQLISDDSKCPRNPIQSESNTESNTKCDILPGANDAPDHPPVISFLLNDKTEYPVYQDQIDKWGKLYPAVDIMQQLRHMKGWLDANPKRRKTKGGILRFVTSWLAKEQDRGGGKHGDDRANCQSSGNTRNFGTYV
nr:MAG TPA: replisome organizer [Caudoviricetes sp.]